MGSGKWMLDFFPIGVTYGGTLPREQWQEDFREIEKAGFNCVRLTLADHTDDEIDYLLDLAAKHDLRVLAVLAPFPVSEKLSELRARIGAAACSAYETVRSTLQAALDEVRQREPEARNMTFRLLRKPGRVGPVPETDELETKAARDEAESYYRMAISRLTARDVIAVWVLPPDPLMSLRGVPQPYEIVRRLDPHRPVVVECVRVEPGVRGPGLLAAASSGGATTQGRLAGFPVAVLRGLGSADIAYAVLPARLRVCGRPLRPEDLSRELWSSLAHGARGVVFETWDPPRGRLWSRTGSVRDLDGSYWPGLKRIASDTVLLAQAPGLKSARPAVPAVAVLVGKRGPIWIPEPALPAGPAAGAYQLLTASRVALSFIGDRATLDELKQYRAIYIPVLLECPESLAGNLAEYVRAGGALIAEAPLAWLDEEGNAYPETPGAGLAQVVGCRERTREAAREPFVPVATTAIAQSVFPYVGANTRFRLDAPCRVDLEVDAGRSAVLDLLDPRTFLATGPAAVIGSCGRGKTAYIAGSLALTYLVSEDEHVLRLLSGILDWMEVPRQVEVLGLTRGFENQFEVSLFEGIDEENRRAVVCLNHSDMSVHPTLTLPAGPPSVVRELLTNSSAHSRTVNGRLQITTRVPEREVRVYWEAQPA